MARKYARKPRARRSKPVAGKKGVRSAIRKQSTKVFNSRVKRAVKTMIETKQITVRGTTNIVPYTGSNASSCDSTNIISFDPIINQGTGDGSRIGNNVNFTSCKFRFLLTLKPVTSAGNACPQVVRLIFMYDRENQQYAPEPYQSSNFIDLNNSVANFSGNLTDTFYRYNTDRYRILGVKTYKVGYANNGQNTDLNTIQSQLFTNNDSKMFIRGSVDCGDWWIKRHKFQDNVGSSKERKLYCLVLTVRQDGITNISTTPVVGMYWEQTYKFTDA